MGSRIWGWSCGRQRTSTCYSDEEVSDIYITLCLWFVLWTNWWSVASHHQIYPWKRCGLFPLPLSILVLLFERVGNIRANQGLLDKWKYGSRAFHEWKMNHFICPAAKMNARAMVPCKYWECFWWPRPHFTAYHDWQRCFLKKHNLELCYELKDEMLCIFFVVQLDTWSKLRCSKQRRESCSSCVTRGFEMFTSCLQGSCIFISLQSSPLQSLVQC